MAASYPTIAELESRDDTAIAPLVTAWAPDQLPAAHDMYLLAKRLGLWEVVQGAGAIAHRFGYARFRLSTTEATECDDPDWTLPPPDWDLTLRAKGQATTDDPAGMAHAETHDNDELKQAITQWRANLVVRAEVDHLPSAFIAHVMNQWLDPTQLDEMRVHIFGAPAMALWRAHSSPAPDEAAPARQRPRRRT